MAKVLFTVSDDEYKAIRDKAKSLGLTTAAYVRNVIKDSLKRNPEAKQAEILRAIRGLIPVFVEAIGRTQQVSEEKVERLTKILIERYNQEL